jgi:hypothetical protein
MVSTSEQSRSKIYALLYAWRILTRIGRQPYNSEVFSVPLPTTPQALGGTFKKDVKLYFLRGLKEVPDMDSTLDLAQSSGMEVSMAFVLKKCWISSIQLNNVDANSGTTPLTVTATLVPEEIYPFDADAAAISALPPIRQFTFQPGLGLA